MGLIADRLNNSTTQPDYVRQQIAQAEAPASPPPAEEPSWYESMANDVASIFNSDESIGDKLLDTASYAINGVGSGIQTVADAGVEALKGTMGFVGNAVSDIGDWAYATGDKISAAYENPSFDSVWQAYDQGIAKPGMAIASTPFVPGQARAVAGALAIPAVASDAINAFSEGDGVMGGTGNVISSFVVDPVSQLVKAASNPTETAQAIYEHPSKIWTDILEPGMVVEMPARGAKKVYDNRSEIKADYKAFREDGINGILDRHIDEGFKDVNHSLRSSIDDGSYMPKYEEERACDDYAPEEAAAPTWDIREDEFIGQPMPHGENGCVEAVVRLGQDNDFLGREYEAGNAYVPTLVEHAKGEGLYEPFDPSRVERGDVIVYGDSDHVVMADGDGGYVGNSSSKQRVVHGSDYTEMSGLTPTGLIKTGKGGGERRIREFDYPEEESYSGEVKSLDNEPVKDDWDMGIYDDEIGRHNSDLVDEQTLEGSIRDYDSVGDGPARKEDPFESYDPMQDPNYLREMERLDSEPDIINSMREDIDTIMEQAVTNKHPSFKDILKNSLSNRDSNSIEAVSFLDEKVPSLGVDRRISVDNTEPKRNIVEDMAMEEAKEILDRDRAEDDSFAMPPELPETKIASEKEKPVFRGKPEGKWTEGAPSREELVNTLDNLFFKTREGGSGLNTKSGVGHAEYGDIEKITGELIPEAIEATLKMAKDPETAKFDNDLHVNDGPHDIRYEELYEEIHKENSDTLDEHENMRFYEVQRNERVMEFLKDFINNPDVAQKRYPDFTRHFSEMLEKPENKDLAKRIHVAQTILKDWNSMPEGARMTAAVNGYSRGKGIRDIIKHPVQATKEKITNIKDTFIEEMLDDKYPLKQVSDEVSNRLGKKLSASEDPYVQARLAQGRGEAQASMLIDNETSKFTRNMASRSSSENAQKVANAINKIFGDGTIKHPVILKDILNTLAKDLDGKYPEYLKSVGAKNWLEALDSYLIARRLLEVKEVSAQQIKKDILSKNNEIEHVIDLMDRVSNLRRNYPDGFSTRVGDYTIENIIGTFTLLNEKVKQLKEERKEMTDSMVAVENYKMPAKESEVHAVVDNAPDELVKAAKDIYQYNDNLMRIARSAGLISNKFYQAMSKKYEAYVPLASDMGEAMESMMHLSSGGGKGIVNIGSVVDAINSAGSTKNVKSALQTIALNTKRILSASNRNMAGQKFLELVDGKNGMGDILERVDNIDTVTNQDNLVNIYVKGVRQVFETEPAIKRALECIDAPYHASAIANILQMPGKLLRNSCTITPAFLMKNLFRDMMGAPVLGGVDRTFKPGVDHSKGLKSRALNDQNWYDYQASGATMANLLTIDRTGVDGMIERLYGEGAWDMTKKVLTSPVRLGTWLNELSENATRAGKFVGDLEHGKTLDEAAIGAKNVSLDFSRAGRFGRQVNRYIPFFNAAIQEPVRLMEAIRENPKKAATVIGMSITLPSIITWTLNSGEEWYQNLPDSERDTNWFITKDLKIPKPFGLGVLFGSSVERGLDQIAGTNEGRKFMPYLKNLVDALTPGGTPQVITPWIEWQSNHSFFKDAAIVPEKYQRLTPDKQYNDSTSQMARDIAGFFGTSPMKVDNLLRGAGGSGVSLGLDTWDAAMGNRNVKNPFKIHSAFTPSTYSRFNNDYYSIKQELEAKYNSTDKGTFKKSKDNQQHRMNQLSAEDRRDYNIFKAADKKIQAINNDRYLSDEEKQAKKTKIMKDAVKASSTYKE